MLADYFVNRFNDLYPDEPVTVRGNTGCRALRWGKDKLVLTSKFAKFVCELIDLNS